jgi:hypothetical protein
LEPTSFTQTITDAVNYTSFFICTECHWKNGAYGMLSFHFNCEFLT